MKNEAESCQQTTKSSQAGNSSYTAKNVLDREAINRPENEKLLRGDMESLKVFQKHEMSIFPLEKLKQVLESHGVEFIEEAV